MIDLTTIVCLHKFLNEPECKDCERDLDENHHPNNYDCPRFYKIKVINVYVSENID